MRITSHAKKRMKERGHFTHREKIKMFKNALHHGLSPDDIKDNKSELRQYLFTKQNNRARVKLYQEYVYIYNKNSKNLITMYKLPSRFLKENNEEQREEIKQI